MATIQESGHTLLSKIERLTKDIGEQAGKPQTLTQLNNRWIGIIPENNELGGTWLMELSHIWFWAKQYHQSTQARKLWTANVLSIPAEYITTALLNSMKMCEQQFLEIPEPEGPVLKDVYDKMRGDGLELTLAGEWIPTHPQTPQPLEQSNAG